MIQKLLSHVFWILQDRCFRLSTWSKSANHVGHPACNTNLQIAIAFPSSTNVSDIVSSDEIGQTDNLLSVAESGTHAISSPEEVQGRPKRQITLSNKARELLSDNQATQLQAILQVGI